MVRQPCLRHKDDLDDSPLYSQGILTSEIAGLVCQANLLLESVKKSEHLRSGHQPFRTVGGRGASGGRS